MSSQIRRAEAIKVWSGFVHQAELKVPMKRGGSMPMFVAWNTMKGQGIVDIAVSFSMMDTKDRLYLIEEEKLDDIIFNYMESIYDNS